MVGYGRSAPEERTRPGDRCRSPRAYGSGKLSKVTPGPASPRLKDSTSILFRPAFLVCCNTVAVSVESATGVVRCAREVFSALFRFSIAFDVTARNGLHSSLRHPVLRGFWRASARRHRKRCSLHFPALAHFSTFSVHFPNAAFSSTSSSGHFTRTQRVWDGQYRLSTLQFRASNSAGTLRRPALAVMQRQCLIRGAEYSGNTGAQLFEASRVCRARSQLAQKGSHQCGLGSLKFSLVFRGQETSPKRQSAGTHLCARPGQQ